MGEFAWLPCGWLLLAVPIPPGMLEKKDDSAEVARDKTKYKDTTMMYLSAPVAIADWARDVKHEAWKAISTMNYQHLESLSQKRAWFARSTCFARSDKDIVTTWAPGQVDCHRYEHSMQPLGLGPSWGTWRPDEHD